MNFRMNFPKAVLIECCQHLAELPFNWINPDTQILTVLWGIQDRIQSNPHELFELTRALLDDLRLARAAANNQQQVDAIDCTIFVSCAPAIHKSRQAGKLGMCFDWIWASISSLHQIGGERRQVNEINFLAFNPANEWFLEVYLYSLPNFIEAAFYTAYRLGGLDDLTERIAEDCWQVLAHLRQDPQSRDDTLALAQMITWAGFQEHPLGQNWADELMSIYESSDDPHQRKNIAMAFTTPANMFSNEGAVEWAQRILDEYNDILREHERIQLRAIAITDTVSWNLYRDALLTEIAELRAFYSERLQDGQSIQEVLELRVSVLYPLFYSMADFALPTDFVEVLYAWYGNSEIPCCEDDVLIILPTHNHQASYIWPEGRWITQREDTGTHDAMQRALGPAIGTYVRGTDGDHDPAAFEGFRFDIPNAEQAQALEQSMEAHYQLPALQEKLPEGWQPKSIVIFPNGPEPLQALIFKNTNIRAPLASSLQELSPFRPIRRINVWIGEILHGQFELEALRIVSDIMEWHLEVFQHEAPTAENFKVFYEDTEADILWVISHGEHDPFSVDGTGLYLSEETCVTFEQLSEFEIPNDNRRLLVLNACSTATTQSRGGLSKIGIAQSLTSKNQSITGNLWPITPYAALVFGAGLAAHLKYHDPATAALLTIELLQDSNEMQNFLIQNYSAEPELVDRLNVAANKIEEITDWGCPILVV